MIRILTISDNVDCPSGFGTQHRLMADALHKAGKWEVLSLGLWDTQRMRRAPAGYWCLPTWDPEAFKQEWRDICAAVSPEIVVTLGDLEMFEHFGSKPFTWVHWNPVDAEPYPMERDKQIKRIDWLVFMSQFGERVYRPHVEGRVRTANIPHGIDTSIFKPVSAREKARLRATWSEFLHTDLSDKRVLVNWDTNQWRKNTPALLEMLTHLPEEVVLCLHCKEDGRGAANGWDLASMAKFPYGVERRVFFTGHGRVKPTERANMSAQRLATFIQMADLRVSATTGEGFGIPTIEAMACGLANVITGCTSNSELISESNSGLLVPASARAVQPGSDQRRTYVSGVWVATTVATALGKWQRARWRRRGLKHVRKLYTAERVARLWVELMDRIAKEIA